MTYPTSAPRHLLNPLGVGAACEEMQDHGGDYGHSPSVDVASDMIQAYLKHDPLHRLLVKILAGERAEVPEAELFRELITEGMKSYDLPD